MLNTKETPKSTNSSLILSAASAFIISLGITVYAISQHRNSSSITNQQPQGLILPTIRTVTALGRLEPAGQIIKLSASNTNQGNRIDKLLVKEGDRVNQGQIIAILDSHDRLQATLLEASEKVNMAQTKLNQVLAGAKQGEIEAQKAHIRRLEAEWKTEQRAQVALINRLQVERSGELAEDNANLARLQAQIQGEIAAQRATISRLRAELKLAEAEKNRYERLYQDGAISNSILDDKIMKQETALEKLKEAQANLTKTEQTGEQELSAARATRNRKESSKIQSIYEAQSNLDKILEGKKQQIKEARADLNRISEVRTVDVSAAKAEVNQTLATLQVAKANLEQSYIRSPINSQILKIHTRPGEIISNNGVVEIGNTQTMYAVAEVYESDLPKVKIGQPAQIKAEALTQTLTGQVSEIGLLVKKQNVVNTDPSANVDARIIEVKIKLDQPSSQKVSGLTNLQVKVIIQQPK